MPVNPAHPLCNPTMKIVGHQFCPYLEDCCGDKRKRVRMKIKMDKLSPNKANRNLPAGWQLPGAQMQHQWGGGWLCPTRLLRGAWGMPGKGGWMNRHTAQWQVATPACHTHTQRGGLGGGQEYSLVAGAPSLPQLPVSPPSLPRQICPLLTELESFPWPLMY